jgi:hypothetical protein
VDTDDKLPEARHGVGANLAHGLLGIADEFVNQLALYCRPFQGFEASAMVTSVAKPKLLYGAETAVVAAPTETASVAKPSKLLKSMTTGGGAAASDNVVAEASPALTSQLLQQGVPQVAVGQTTQLATAPAAAATAPQRFEAPTGPNGLRLYACASVDSDDCGSKQVADLFCAQNGSASAGGFDTSRQKVAAETLQGEKCGKKKCKVFDVIACQ